MAGKGSGTELSQAKAEFLTALNMLLTTLLHAVYLVIAAYFPDPATLRTIEGGALDNLDHADDDA